VTEELLAGFLVVGFHGDVSLTVAARTWTLSNSITTWSGLALARLAWSPDAQDPDRALLAILLAVVLASASSAPQPPPCSRSCAALNCDCA
jgi:hypothetical protein